MANVLDKIARFPKITAGYIREIAPASAGQGLTIDAIQILQMFAEKVSVSANVNIIHLNFNKEI